MLNEDGEAQSEARRFIWFTVVSDCVFFTAMYAVTMEPESDFYLFFFVPLVTGMTFLPRREGLKVLGIVMVGLAVSLGLIFWRWEYHTPEPPHVITLQRLIVHVFSLRALAFLCACLPLGVLVDTTRRLKISEMRLEQTESFYTSLVKTIPEFIFRKNKDKCFDFVSEGFCKYLGKPREKIIGKDDYQFFPVELAEAYRKDDDLILSGKVDVIRKEEENRLKDGKGVTRTRIVQVTKVPVQNSQGEIIGIQASFLDVTERKKERHKMLRWFVHDTPKPLVIIRDKHIHNLRQAVQSIGDDKVRVEAEKVCQKISTIIEFALACFDAYGFLSDNEQYSWKWGEQDGSEFHLQEVVDIVLQSVKPNEDEIRFLKTFTDNPKIQSDRYKVIALVFLLVDNAIKAVKKDPKEKMEIQITLEVVQATLWIRVKDNGCGMTDAQKAKCSKEGFSDFGSSGLGLAIVYGFAALAGGGVTIDTVVNQGTTVSVGIAKFRTSP